MSSSTPPANASPDRLAIANTIAKRLYALGAKRVYLFGSLAMGYPADTKSDVDLAVEGLPWAKAERVRREATAEYGFKIDVVVMELARAQLRAGIIRQRRLIPAS